MSNPGHTRPGGQRPGFTRLPDGRGRMVVLIPLSSGEQLRNDLLLAWGVLYSSTERVDVTGRNTCLAGLRLVGGQETQQTAEAWAWVRVYEDIPETAEIQVGKNRRIEKDDGTVEIIAEFLQLAAATAVTVTIGSITAPAPDEATAVLAQQDRQNDGALRRITRRYVSAGLLATSVRALGDGLNEVTWVSVRTKLTPNGVVVADSAQKPNGIPVYTVTTRQGAASGGTPDAVTYSFASQRRWQAPGRLKAELISKTVLTPGEIPTSYTFKTMALNKSAPVTFEALAVTVAITYQSSSAVGTVTPAQWDPQKWATVDADIILRGPRPMRRVQDYPGYAVDDASGVSAISVTATAGSGSAAFVYGEGELLFQGDNVHKLTVTGPVYPATESRTIEPVRVEPDFQALDGTTWYKRTQVYATLPALPAMPTLST